MFRPVLGLVFACGLASSAGAQVDVLFRSGQADSAGFALAGFDRPRGSGAGAVVTRARTYALFARTGGVVTELLRTGDALPAPYTGTFNRFRSPVVNTAGTIAFYATINSADGSEGLFLYDAGIVTPVIVTEEQGAIGAFDVSDPGNVAYVRDDVLYLWDRMAVSLIRLIGREDSAPGGGIFRSLGPIALNAGDVVAFAASRRNGGEGVFTSARVGNPAFVADRRFGTGAIAINAAGQVAFTSDGRSASDDVLRWDAANGAVKVMSMGASTIGGKIVSFDPECVALDDAGRVVAEAQMDATGSPRKLVIADGGELRISNTALARTAGDFSTILTADGQLVFTQDRRLTRFDIASRDFAFDVTGTTDTPLGQGIATETPSRNAAGTEVFTASREMLESIAGGVAQPIVAVGDRVRVQDDDFTITAIGAHVAFGAQVVFIATLGGTDPALLSAHDGRIEVVVRFGGPSPVGGSFVSLSDVLEPSGDGVLFVGSVSGGKAAAGIFHASLTSGKLRPLATSARKGKNRFSNFATPTAVGSGVAFRADRGDKGGIFLAAGKGVRTLFVSGKKAPILGGKISGLRAFVGGDAGVFSAIAIEEGDADSALYLSTGRGRPRAFIVDGDATPTGGAYKSVGTAVLASNGPTMAFLVPVFGAAGARGLFTATGATLTTRLLDGAVIGDGNRISLVDTDVLGFEGDAVLLTGRLLGTATASRALVAVH